MNDLIRHEETIQIKLIQDIRNKLTNFQEISIIDIVPEIRKFLEDKLYSQFISPTSNYEDIIRSNLLNYILYDDVVLIPFQVMVDHTIRKVYGIDIDTLLELAKSKIIILTLAYYPLEYVLIRNSILDKLDYKPPCIMMRIKQILTLTVCLYYGFARN